MSSIPLADDCPQRSKDVPASSSTSSNVDVNKSAVPIPVPRPVPPPVPFQTVSRYDNLSDGSIVDKDIPQHHHQQQFPHGAQPRFPYASTVMERYRPPNYESPPPPTGRSSQGPAATTISKTSSLEISEPSTPPLQLQAELHITEPPSFGHYRMLLASLILTTILAVGSALDARLQCVSHEVYYLLELFDDDTIDADEMISLAQQSSDCVDMFRRVMLPVGGVTLILGTMAHYFIHSHIQAMAALPNHIIRPSHLSASLKLLVLLVGIQAIWTYGIFEIMLRPKMNSSENGRNPYNSLAAVDQMGHVGDNANLYYLSWISEALIMALVYQVLVDCVRWCRRGFHHQQRTQHPLIESKSSMNAVAKMANPVTGVPTTAATWQQQHQQQQVLLHAIITSDLEGVHDNLKTMLSYTSARKLQSLYNQRRKTWYDFMIRLRMRSGFWVAALCSAIVVLVSSGLLFRSILMNRAIQIMGYDDDNDNEDGTYDNSIAYRDVCTILKSTQQQKQSSDYLPPQLCLRTSLSVVSGGVAAGLCMTAIVLHLLVRRKAANDLDRQCGAFAFDMLQATSIPTGTHIPLWCEFFLSLCLSILLGLNAVFATGVQGPAATVGNLYYASWIGFLLCLRICLGCVEELYEVETQGEMMGDEESHHVPRTNYCPRNDAGTPAPTSATRIPSRSNGSDVTDVIENVRPGRLRKYCFLSIFSTICSASAWDAACNQDSELTMHQKYMILAPSVVAVLSILLFLLCLKNKTYKVVSQFRCGGILSILCFAIWLANLLITMHGSSSWAVNAIGEIKMANLYYFSWAAIITAGFQMISFFKDILGRQQEKSIMLIVWAAISKVCFVILGSSYHIWGKIADNCSDENVIQEWSETTYCSRTIFAMVVAITGNVLGSLVVLSRVTHCRICTHRIRIHVEAAISIFLVLVFGAAVALITSIGGPGQTVGDLYYSTWLAFWVAIGIFVSCYDQIKQEEVDMKDVVGVEYINFQYSSVA